MKSINYKKLLAVLLTVCLAVALCVTPGFSVSATDVWDGSSVSDALEGTGTLDDPYLISSGADLKYWQTQAAGGAAYSGKYFLLTNDIDMGDREIYIYTFAGIFDGNGYEIKGIKTVLNTLSNVGFFRTFNGEVKNLTLSGLIWGQSNVGGFAGCIGTAGTRTFTNCVNNLTVKSTNTSGSCVGGFVGNASPSNPSITLNFFSCTNNGTVTSAKSGAQQANTAGFVGYVSGNTTVNIRYSSNNGEVSNSGTETTEVAGFIGSVSGIISFDSCINTGTITASYAVGGFIGWNRGNKALTMKNCINLGQINVTRTSGNAWADGIFAVAGNYSGTATTSNVYKLTGCVDFGTATNNQAGNAKLIGTEVLISDFTAGNIRSMLGYCFTLDDEGAPTLIKYDGVGRADDPYIISTKEQLIMLSQIVTGSDKQWTNYTDVSFALGADIDLESDAAFIGIGNGYKTFQGDFDGRGFTVSGVYISSAHILGTGFFGKIAGTHDRHISNLNVEGTVRCTGAASGETDLTKAGGLVGMNSCKLYLSNCRFNGTAYSACTNANKSGVGGLVGYVDNDLIINRCSVSGTIDGFGRCAALVACLNAEYTVIIHNSFSDATVTGVGATDGSNPTAAGIIGFVGGSGVAEINNCYFYGTAPTARASGYAGPIVNFVDGTGTLTCSHTYYNSDNNAAESAGYEYGEGKSETDFADGTVKDLLNAGAGEDLFIQGQYYPVAGTAYDVDGDFNITVGDANRVLRYIDSEATLSAVQVILVDTDGDFDVDLDDYFVIKRAALDAISAGGGGAPAADPNWSEIS